MWHFRKAEYEDTIAESKLSEFFSGSPSEAIVREAFQNSLDAVEDTSQPVRMVLSLGSARPSDFAEAYEPLLEHWQAVENAPAIGKSARYLTVEDFNTKGLLGPIDKEETPHGSLYSFWWEEGRSKKRTGSGGSHGVGKSTLSGASYSRAFLALTRRKPGQELLIGYSILPPHSLGETEYLGYARFGKRVRRAKDDLNVIYPFTDRDDGEVLSRFRMHARLARKDEAGLSVFIPDLRKEIDTGALLESVIKNFFFPIIREKLVVELRDLDAGQTISVNKGNVLSLAEERGYPADLISTIKVSLEATRLASRNQFFFLHPNFEFSAENDRLTTASFTAANLREMQISFGDGALVAARLAMPFRMHDGKLKQGYVDLFAQSGEEAPRIYRAFRGNILIEREKCRATQPFSVLILDIFDDGDDNELCEYMKYAEDPGHTEWKNSAHRRSQRRYASTERWQQTLVQRMAADFIAMLSGSEAEEKVDDFADDIFFIEKEAEDDSAETGKKNRGTRKGPDGPVPPVDIPPASPPLFRIQRLTAGRAAIAGTDHLALALKESGNVRGRVWAANIIFGASKSKWRKSHIPLDFDFGAEGMVSARGAKVRILSANNLEFVAEQDDFLIEFEGFDPNRDVHIDVRKMAEPKQ